MNKGLLSGDQLPTILIILTFIAITSIIYSNTLNAPFLMDDIISISENENIRVSDLSIRTLWEANGMANYKNRPVAMLSFALNYYFHQYSLPGYHVVNIAIHLINTIFIYLLFKITLTITAPSSNRYAPFVAAVLWCVHPLHTESVTYLTQRMTSMGTMFYLLSLLLYIKGRRSRIDIAKTGRGNAPLFWYAGCGLAFLLALGSKENTIMLPFVIILYEWFFFRDLDRVWFKRMCLLIGVCLAIGFISAVIYREGNPWEAMMNGYQNRIFTLPQRVMTEWRVIMYYLSLLVFPLPSRLNLDHDYPLSLFLLNPFTTILSLTAIICLMVLALYTARRNRIMSFAIFWYLINLAIESSVIELEIIFEHRTYLPSVFLFYAAVLTIQPYLRPHWCKALTAGGLILLLAIGTYMRNETWRNAIRLHKDCATKAPNKTRPRVSLGMALSDQKLWDQSLRQYFLALQLDCQEIDTPALLFVNIGLTLVEKNSLQKAVVFYEKFFHIADKFGYALQNKSEFLSKTHYNLGNLFSRLNRLEEAAAEYRNAIAIDPGNSRAQNNLGNVLAILGRHEEARQAYEKALETDPEYRDARQNIDRITVLLQAGIEPKGPRPDHIFQYDQGNRLYKNREFDAAVRAYENALKAKPDFSPAIKALAMIYAQKGEIETSISYFQQLTAIEPENAVAHYNLACMYARNNQIHDSLHYLKLAIRKGYDKWETLRTDRDLENIRDSKEFKNLLTTHDPAR